MIEDTIISVSSVVLRSVVGTVTNVLAVEMQSSLRTVDAT